MAAVPGFKSQHQSSSAAPFPAPPTIGHSCQHSQQVWPCGVEPFISKLSGPHYKSQIGAPFLAAPGYIIVIVTEILQDSVSPLSFLLIILSVAHC